MLLRKRVCAALGTAALWLALLFPTCSFSTTEICKELNLKPLHCIRGTAVNILGEPISGATITIFAGGTARTAVKTGADGRFLFGEFAPGNYEVRVQADGFRAFQFPIVVVKPNSKCKQALEIGLTTGYPENCTAVRLVER